METVCKGKKNAPYGAEKNMVSKGNIYSERHRGKRSRGKLNRFFGV